MSLQKLSLRYDETLLTDLFDVVARFVLASGGDGDAWIISEKYKELADLFELCEKKSGNWFTERYTGDGLISFSHEQESIAFVDNRTRLPNYAGDIVVEI